MNQIPSAMDQVADRDPYPFYSYIQEQEGLVWDESMRGWLVAGYEDCKFVEINEASFRHPYADASQELIEIKGGRRNITIVQGEEHGKLHRFLVQLFAPRLMKDYRQDHISPVIEAALTKFVHLGSAELVSDFSTQIPPRVIMSLMGLDWRDDDLAKEVFDLHETVMNWVGTQNSGETQTLEARAAAEKITSILLPHLRQRKDHPEKDLISRVWQEAPAVIEDFDEQDVLATAREMFLGGTDTTVHALSNALYVLLTKPDLLARVSTERDLIPNFVEEVLRYFGSVQFRFRIANQDCELRGTKVRKDDVLILINSAANRDPARYPDPHQFDIDRPRIKDHLAFNTGPRTCVGASLAKAELIDSINALLDRVGNLRLDPSKPQPVFQKHYIRSFAPLHVLFDPK